MLLPAATINEPTSGHTGVALAAAQAYRQETGDGAPMVIAATASPYKFAGSVLEAIEGTAPEGDAFAAADRLSRISGTPVPEAVEEVRRSPIRHTRECAVSEMEDVVKEILNL